MIYLDNAATTELAPEVIEAMHRAEPIFGNPSSVHSVGNEAHSLLDESRKTVANFLNCRESEIIFTSGGSESDNLAIRGIVEENRKPHYAKAARGRQKTENSEKTHVITSAIEHHAVLHTIQELEKEGKIEATYIQPNAEGIISAESVTKAIKPNTILVSIMYVNNETGTINPIREIGLAISNYLSSNCPKQIPNKNQRIFFHTDAVQAAGYLDMDVKNLGVDLLTFTGHKIHGPKGVGVLFLKKGTPVKSQITGGGHEGNRRAGTENIVGIAGLAAAVEKVRKPHFAKATRGRQKTPLRQGYEGQAENGKQLAALRDKLENYFLENVAEARLNGDKNARIPSVTNVSFKNAEGESIVLLLDANGICVSSGSACTSQSLAPSHVLTAMGVPVEYTHGSIRFSLSESTTEADIDKVIEVLPPIIERLRQMSPLQ